MEQKLYILMLVKNKHDYIFLGSFGLYESALHHIVMRNQHNKNKKIFDKEKCDMFIENNEYIIFKSEINQTIRVNENIEDSEENLKNFKLENKNRLDKNSCTLC